MIWILLALGAAMMVKRFQVGDAVVTIEGPDISELSPTSYSLKIRHMAVAIARAEGFFVAGSVPARNHNPGNLKAEAIPGNFPRDSRGFVVFDSDDQGWAALHKQLQLIIDGRSAFYSLDMTIEQMGARWEADPGNAWATNVAAGVNATTDTRLSEVLT